MYLQDGTKRACNLWIQKLLPRDRQMQLMSWSQDSTKHKHIVHVILCIDQIPLACKSSLHREEC